MDHRTKGFTLVELLVVVAVIAAIALVTLINAPTQSNERNMNVADQEIAATLRQAESNALSGNEIGGVQGFWGVAFGAATGTQPFMRLFYATSTSGLASGTTEGYTPLPQNINYETSSIPSGGTLYVYYSNGSLPSLGPQGVYASCTGFTCPATSTITIVLTTTGIGSTLTSTITVAPTGAVSY
jgi:prepilin-type N-terminal cleavage/methylation domain-containing protein